jgi:hypothetical protein
MEMLEGPVTQKLKLDARTQYLDRMESRRFWTSLGLSVFASTALAVGAVQGLGYAFVGIFGFLAGCALMGFLSGPKAKELLPRISARKPDPLKLVQGGGVRRR